MLLALDRCLPEVALIRAAQSGDRAAFGELYRQYPAGARCRTRAAHGPETPFFSDASPAFTSALLQYDQRANPESLASVLATARARDALSLWHLLHRTSGAERGRVYDRYAHLVALPPSVTREAILAGQPQAFDAAWNALDLGDAGWWREWKRRW